GAADFGRRGIPLRRKHFPDSSRSLWYARRQSPLSLPSNQRRTSVGGSTFDHSNRRHAGSDRRRRIFPNFPIYDPSQAASEGRGRGATTRDVSASMGD